MPNFLHQHDARILKKVTNAKMLLNVRRREAAVTLVF